MSIDNFTQLRTVKSRRPYLKASSLVVYIGLLFVLVAFVVSGYKSPSVGADHQVAPVAQSQPTQAANVAPLTTIDEVNSANLAASVASSANLSVADSVYNQSISISTSADLGQYDATTIDKVSTANDVTTNVGVLTNYTVVEGDTAASIAAKFGVSAQTVRWANNLTGDAVAIGSTVVVPVADGVVYTVKAGDDLNAVAAKYKSNIDDIVMINDLSGTTAAADAKLLLPSGVLPVKEQPGYRPPVTHSTAGNSDTGSRSSLFVPVSNGNRYAYGYCTWYAYNRRMQLGMPIPSNLGNANTWASRARAAGYLVDRTPAVGAVFQTSAGYAGHVGIVERVNPDGSIFVSEMNNQAYGGWGIVSTRTIYNPGDYNYIH